MNLIAFICIFGEFLIGSGERSLTELLDDEAGALEAVGAMEIYRRQENLDVLVPEVPYNIQQSEGRRSMMKSLGASAVATAEDNSDEDDSIEISNEEGNDKEDSDEWKPEDLQTCGFTSQRRPQFIGSHFRIVGGRNAEAGAWPWMAGVAYSEENSTRLVFNCGGSLVSATHVITAAHCLLRPPNILKAVRLGVTKLTDRSSAMDVLIRKAVPHPEFDWRTAQNDIAVIFLEHPVIFTEAIHPICLPQGEMELSDYKNTFPYVVGWGAISQDKLFSLWLKEVRLPVVDNEICKSIYKSLPSGKQTSITENQICCGYVKGGHDACQGDSGGPLMLPTQPHPRGEIYVLIGVVSMGDGCAKPGIPGVYTRVTSYLDWLDDVMAEDRKR